MEKFILIVRENLNEIGQFTTENRFARSPDMMPWVNALIDSGKYIMGAPFLISGSYVTQNETINDGEFLNSTEGLSGFDIIFAENFEEATAIAQACPMVKSGFAVREVRQLVDMGVGLFGEFFKHFQSNKFAIFCGFCLVSKTRKSSIVLSTYL